MAKPLKAPSWFLRDFSLADGVFNDERTAVIGCIHPSIAVQLVAGGHAPKGVGPAIIEIASVEEAIRKRLADEGFLQKELEIKLSIEPTPGESLTSPEFQSELSAFAHALQEHGIEASQRWFTQDAVGGGGWGTGEFTVIVTAVTSLITGAAGIAGGVDSRQVWSQDTSKIRRYRGRSANAGRSEESPTSGSGSPAKSIQSHP
jgi:hypothetical protein